MMKDNYHHGDLKSELIQEGLKILDKDGYDAFSLRKVAKACNVSHTAPYRHFKDKDDLVAAIATKALKAFNSCLEEAVAKFPSDPKKQIMEMGYAYVSFFAENPEYLRLLFFSDIKLSSRIKSCQPESHLTEGHPYMTLYKAVARYKEKYTEEPMDQNELVLYCWGLVHGISVLMNINEFPFGDKGLELVRNIIKSDRFLSQH